MDETLVENEYQIIDLTEVSPHGPQLEDILFELFYLDLAVH